MTALDIDWVNVLEAVSYVPNETKSHSRRGVVSWHYLTSYKLTHEK